MIVVYVMVVTLMTLDVVAVKQLHQVVIIHVVLHWQMMIAVYVVVMAVHVLQV